MNGNRLPEPGTDAQYDALRAVINNVALKDPETLYTLCLCLLRFFKTVGLESVVMSWNEMSLHGGGPGDYCGVGFGIDTANRMVAIMALDGDSPSSLMAQASGNCPGGEVIGINLDDPEGKVN